MYNIAFVILGKILIFGKLQHEKAIANLIQGVPIQRIGLRHRNQTNR